jgi:hypothetical protein
MDSIINDIENIRAPDEVKREQLLEDNRSDFDKQMDEALYLSLQELKEQEEINKLYEDDIFDTYLSETKKRKELFRDLLFDLNKLTKFDKDIKEIYEIIEPIIDTYCGQFINFCELDEETYDRIFKVIGTVRTNKNNIEVLKSILIKNH